MGLADAFEPEDRMTIKFSDYQDLVGAAESAVLIKNAIAAEIPHAEIRKMLTGKNDELEEYRKTGLSPDQLREMDRLYAEKCKEVATLTKEKDLLQKQLDDLAAHCKKIETVKVDAVVQDKQ